MVKRCEVIKNNDAVTVVLFGETEIQFPSIHKNVKTVYVCSSKEGYHIVDAEVCEKHIEIPKKKKSVAKKAQKIVEETTEVEE